VRGSFEVVVRGVQIEQVTFTEHGRRLASITSKPGGTAFNARIPALRGAGVHHIAARVRFSRASGAKARSLRLTYQTCSPAPTTPRFTG
jgi:hypothetical protein